MGVTGTSVLHAEAHEHRVEILDLVDALSAMPDTSNRLKSALGKWPGLWARIALVFHLITQADARARGMTAPGLVTIVDKGVAIMVTSYMRDILLPHLLRAEAVMFATEQTQHAKWIAEFILSKRQEGITTRDIMRSYRPFKAPEQRREMIEVMSSLEAMGWVREEARPDGRPQPISWSINPKGSYRLCRTGKAREIRAPSQEGSHSGNRCATREARRGRMMRTNVACACARGKAFWVYLIYIAIDLLACAQATLSTLER